ncbi:MAG: hypothetical protein F8N36_13945 [Desulfovibrio sp.]|nr:hypothetical protein [Desulfovibrio sp.]
MGCAWFDVYPDKGEKFSVELRRELSDYERSTLNKRTDPEREIIPTIGMLRRESRGNIPIPKEIVRDFNAWRLADWETQIAKMRSQPERYGEILAEDPLFRRPKPVGAVHFENMKDTDHGYFWVVDVAPAEPTLAPAELAA